MCLLKDAHFHVVYEFKKLLLHRLEVVFESDQVPVRRKVVNVDSAERLILLTPKGVKLRQPFPVLFDGLC